MERANSCILLTLASLPSFFFPPNSHAFHWYKTVDLRVFIVLLLCTYQFGFFQICRTASPMKLRHSAAWHLRLTQRGIIFHQRDVFQRNHSTEYYAVIKWPTILVPQNPEWGRLTMWYFVIWNKELTVPRVVFCANDDRYKTSAL